MLNCFLGHELHKFPVFSRGGCWYRLRKASKQVCFEVQSTGLHADLQSLCCDKNIKMATRKSKGQKETNEDHDMMVAASWIPTNHAERVRRPSLRMNIVREQTRLWLHKRMVNFQQHRPHPPILQRAARSLHHHTLSKIRQTEGITS